MHTEPCCLAPEPLYSESRPVLVSASSGGSTVAVCMESYYSDTAHQPPVATPDHATTPGEHKGDTHTHTLESLRWGQQMEAWVGDSP